VVPFRDSVKLLGVTLDSVLTMDRHVTEVTRSCSYHTRSLRHIRPLLTLDVANMIALCHLGWTTPTDCCTARRSTTSTGCRWRKIFWSGQFFKLLGQPVPPNCVVSFTGCQFDSGFPTRLLSSPTRHVPPANWLTCVASCKTTDQPEHYNHRTSIILASCKPGCKPGRRLA